MKRSDEALAEAQKLIELSLRAEVDPEQRRELMQMCKSWLNSRPLPDGCVERRVYEDAVSSTYLMMVEEWCNEEALKAYLSSGPFRALIGAVKVLGRFVDVRLSEGEIIEAGS